MKALSFFLLPIIYSEIVTTERVFPKRGLSLHLLPFPEAS